jgi:5-methyltetrahydropteroyltriglutamate--homocysteine methyltransferase
VLDYPVDELDLELTNGDYEQIDVFREPEFTLDLALGVVDNHTAEVESVEQIKRNIRQGLKVVPPERLTISPDCGLKLLPREVAYEKMANMVTAAREVEAELDDGEIEVPARAASADD